MPQNITWTKADLSKLLGTHKAMLILAPNRSAAAVSYIYHCK